MIITGNSAYPVGLDISDLSLKMVQLKKSGRKIKIKAMGRTELKPGMIESGEIKDKQGVSKAINKLINDPEIGKVDTNEVVACLPEAKTFLKLIKIKDDYGETEESVKAEIEKNVPMDIDDIYYDWQIIKSSSREKIVLAGASSKKLINDYTSVIGESKLTVAALEPEPISICRCLLEEERPKAKKKDSGNYGIIDIGAANASLAIYAAGTLVFTAQMPISGEKITEKISQSLKIDRQKAEKMKIIYSLDEDKQEKKEVNKILSEMVKDLSKRIRQVLDFYNKNYSHWGKVDKLLLCGGGANFKNLEKILSIETDIESFRGNALNNINEDRDDFLNYFQKTYSLKTKLTSKDIKNKRKKKKFTKVGQDLSPTFATTIGLALRNIFIKDS